jgi:hypothetical protein
MHYAAKYINFQGVLQMLVSFMWLLLRPDAPFGPVYMTIHIEVSFICELHSGQKKIVIVSCIQH